LNHQVFATVNPEQNGRYKAVMATPPPYPCAMVVLPAEVTWVGDQDALEGVSSSL
jgi:hypothetical protein